MRTHRGLSAVVGTVFLVAVVIGALSYVSYSIDVMGNFSQNMIAEEKRQQAKQDEAFEVSRIDIVGGNELGGIIKNSGDIPVELKTLYVDEQGTNDVVQKYTLDEAIPPGGTVNIEDLLDVPIDPTKGYNMKVVTSRGEVNSFYVNSVADENVYVSLTANPAVIPSTFETTLLFTVVNNMSNGNYLYNLTPVMNDTTTTLIEGSNGITSSIISGPTPASYDALGPGEVAIFSYSYELTSETAGDLQHFNVTLSNGDTLNAGLATVQIKEVPIATDAGSALTSYGLTDASQVLTDVLYFHSLTSNTPNGEYPMDGASPNAAGTTSSPNGNTLEFISASMIAQTTVPIGKYNASLNYFSNVVPLGFPEPTFAFMMDTKDCGQSQRICDAIGTVDNDKGMKEEEQDPDFSGDFDAGGGPHDDEYFSFRESRGDEWFQDDGNYDNVSPDLYPDTMAVWTRIPSTSLSYQPLVHFGDRNSGEDEMGIYIVDGGEIEFQFSTAGQSDSVDCQSSLTYDDNTWLHIVGVRDGVHSCKLYINGTQVDSDTASHGTSSVDVDFNAIGSRDNDGNPELSADVASYIFWDDAALTADQVEDLYYTNYGTNGTRLYMKVEVVSNDGLTVEHTIVPETKIELPYHDVTLNQDSSDPATWLSLQVGNSTDLKYTQSNMTATSTSVATLEIGERLKLTLDWKDNDEQNLPINILFDDSTGWVLPDGPSYFQTPDPTPRWPSFLTFDSLDQVKYLAYNEGPGGIWFVYSGTRLVLTSNDELTSWSAVPQYVNQTDGPTPCCTHAEITPYQDSIYIPAEYYAELEFYPIQFPPSPDLTPCGGCEVVTGQYDAALYLQGYDEDGETFKKTVDLGLVTITGNP